MTSVLSRPARDGERVATRRHYLMCSPEHFAVTYAINPWMHPGVAVDVERALAQWDALRRTYLDLGHRVDLLDPLPGLPDMVYTANGATVVDGVVYGARFRYAQRAAEAAAHRAWFQAEGFARVVVPDFVNEGEGDLLVAGKVILAGSGFRLAHHGGGIDRPPPMLGEHNDEVLAEAGYSAAEIADFRAEGVT